MNRFAAIHQFHPGTAHGDAITQQMFVLQKHLRSFGVQSEIFAEYIPQELQDRIHPIRSYEGDKDNLFFVHHSLGSPDLDEVFDLPDHLVAIYHNVTPERYFAVRRIRDLVRLGHDQLQMLALRSGIGVADSNFNRREMLKAGFERVEVLPVRVDYSQFENASGSILRSSDWLYVGRIVGNKCQHELVRAFAYYTGFDPDSRLVLVGDTSMTDYVDYVKSEAQRLGVAGRVVLLGKVSDRQLVSAFAEAGVFVSLSEHEGFGVPVLEAMAAGVPVVCYGAAALPEVMGGAGILLRDKDPKIVAATVQALREDQELRRKLVARQKVRVGQVQRFDTRALLERVIDRASGTRYPLEVQIQGPFETSYSLAVLNRELALALAKLPDRAASIYATEGPGDYQPDPTDLERFPEATKLFYRSLDVPYPDVVIRQMWPPRVIDSPGAITCEYFGWEESRIPQKMADDFNRYLNGVGVMSSFVRDVLRDSGVDVPIEVVGIGVPPHDPEATVDLPELVGLKKTRFLHVSSAFPRKAIDVLLRAYFSAFDSSDDVTLVLKTFPNPHNEVEKILGELRAGHSNPPDVRWIDRDLDDREIAGLHNLASCYVHPARGEGFGLPVAEAMLAGVPVIALAYSGLADFVSEETAVTIPFTLEPARTHFEVPGSVWAEPNLECLTIEMRRFFDEPARPELANKVETARRLISERYSWEAVARRWDAFIAELERSSHRLRVAMVSTWNSKCGIAENTKSIVDSANDLVDFEIFADTGSAAVDRRLDEGIIRAWHSRWVPDLGELDDALGLSDPEVVHVQFNFGFFELNRLAALMERQLESRAVVVTLHRTNDIEVDHELVSLSSIAPTLTKLDRLIVHQDVDAKRLEALGITDNVTVIPIGTAAPPDISFEEARANLASTGGPVIGTFGFLLPHKGILDLVKAVGRLRHELPDIRLVALCSRHPAAASGEYENLVTSAIEDLGLQDNVTLVTDYLSEDVSRAILRGVDAIVLPYKETEESSSAALRFVLPAERPVIVTDLPIFQDCRDAVLAVDPRDPSKLDEAVRSVLVDPAVSSDLAERAARGARRFRWTRVVADHRKVYAEAQRSYRDRVSARERH